MNIYILNGKMFTTKKEAYSYLKRILPLPTYFSNNLDSLYDCLVDYLQNATIILINQKDLLDNLNDYGKNIIDVFEDVTKNVENFTFIKQ
ncbi:MAG TPA: barstar family protein [Erysipelotrichaceae bacterium]|jgi:RNAse (barnase) inhibitor barstar|nr:barstar family protein [Erysipelotrichia bacterium]HPX32315.1 barstar family protein [Erysipelotrichaceae bacterium]HQA84826.1 barstar family protein [Erysipelotrichaceae bacterium]